MRDIDELRFRFTEFFRAAGHIIVPPASLIPDDPSVLLTTAGMQQFKPYYTGDRDPMKDVHGTLGKPLGSSRVASVQPCVRTSDIDEVGDSLHLTFFEMCGNFAFRDAYFKREAIEYAWQFLTHELGIPPSRLAVTVFAGDHVVPKDEESPALWKELGIPENRMIACGRDTNFWGPTGPEGPCGPTTEIHYDRTEESCPKGKACLPNCPCGRWLELWNLVFNEFYSDPEGNLTPLPEKGVDTGMGLERLALVMFETPDVFTTPLGSEAISWMMLHSPRFPEAVREEVSHHRLRHAVLLAERQDHEMLGLRGARVILDHMRASTFLSFAGVLPSNTDRGYVLRRLIRRAALYARLLGLPAEWQGVLLDQIIAFFSRAYPDVAAAKERILATLRQETEKFEGTIARGLREFERIVEERRMANEAISGEDLFMLFETYGFPIELSKELASAEGVTINDRDIEAVREAHRERSRAGSERKFGGHGLVLDTGELRAMNEEEVRKVTRLHTATHLLQAALRHILGETVAQRGSDITAERLRFDFSFPRKLTPEERSAVEALVNEKIREDLPVVREEMPFRDAVASGALAFAKGTYPEIVSVYSIDGFSREVCGGPHVSRTSEVGTFRIVKEEATAAGVRRIRATVSP